MSSTDLHWRICVGRQKVQTFFFLRVRLARDSLQYQVRPVWLVDGHHFNILIHVFDYIGEWSLANFTLEFSEIVGGHDSMEFFLDFTVDPLFQAADMEVPATSLASTWRNQGIFSFVLVG